MTTLTQSLQSIAQQTRLAAQGLASQSTASKNAALEAIAQALEAATPEILAANQADCEQAQADGIPGALFARLKLSPFKLGGA